MGNEQLFIGFVGMAISLLLGLLGIAVSIFFGLNGLAKKIATKEDLLAFLFAFSKSSNEKRTIALEDLKEGYSLAKSLLGGPTTLT